ncbi:unnamed protein product [Closterium sp. Naga37s-1]|nr:unnamed protein product [Closterium sp. Naga37s-1]
MPQLGRGRLVELFASWCNNLAPVWEKVVTALKGIVTAAAVDYDANPSLAQEYGVQGIPTIKVFAPHLKTPADYEGQLDTKAIVDFALSQVWYVWAEAGAQPALRRPKIPFLPRPPRLSPHPLTLCLTCVRRYVWAEAGAQPALEKALGMGGYGYPALIALNAKRQRFSPFKSAFEQEHLSEFVRLAARGGRGIEPVESIPEAESREPWDGKDGQVVEEEFSLEDLMGDDSPAAAAAAADEL